MTHEPFIHAIAHAVPPHAYPQQDIGHILGRTLEPGSRTARFMERIYRHSGISTRHSVIPDYRKGKPDGVFFSGADGVWMEPSTGARNAIYEREAPGLYETAARRVLEKVETGPVTHVITVSCTGFFAPGPDFELVKRLGLPPSTQRYHLGFMGCYAALPALRLASAFVRADPDSVVLVVCAELCTLHLQETRAIEGDDPSLDAMVSASVFADGAAAAIVAAPRPSSGFELKAFSSHVAPNSEGDMAWRIGDRGFDMVLSTYVPDILESNIGDVIEGVIDDPAVVDIWAVHPGGRAILDKVSRGLQLEPNADGSDPLAPSRHVLDTYGNMSSPTILFVLEEVLARSQAGDDVCALAFGPGLTVETARLTRV